MSVGVGGQLRQPAVERHRVRLCVCAFSRACCELFSINRQVDCVACPSEPRLLLRVLAHSTSLAATRGKLISRFGRRVGAGDLASPAMPVTPRVSSEEKRIARNTHERGYIPHAREGGGLAARKVRACRPALSQVFCEARSLACGQERRPRVALLRCPRR